MTPFLDVKICSLEAPKWYSFDCIVYADPFEGEKILSGISGVCTERIVNV
jgi:hypothetical protein